MYTPLIRKMILIHICLACFCWTGQSQSLINPLKMDQRLPEELWNLPLQSVNHPTNQKVTRLSDYRGKLILIDFWATWCGTCLNGISKTLSLQERFGERIQFLPVTYESIEIITSFFDSRKGGKYRHLYSVVGDTLLKQYFPHTGIPHVVWVAPDGTFLNTTLSDEVTVDNISGILEGELMEMETKVDLDRRGPLFLSELFGKQMELKSYAVLAKGAHPGLPSGNRFSRDSSGTVYGRSMTNVPMMRLLSPIFTALFKEKGERFNLKRLIVEVEEPYLLDVIYREDSSYEKFNLYSYEVRVPMRSADSLYHYMLEGLNRYSDYVATMEVRTVSCLKLVRTSTVDKIRTIGGKKINTFGASIREDYVIHNSFLADMVNGLNDHSAIDLPVIDGTAYSGGVDIVLSGVKDLMSLKKALNEYDLDLVETAEDLRMFVVRDK